MGVNLNCEITLQYLLRDVKGRKECPTNPCKNSQSTCKFMTLCSMREIQDHQLDPTLGLVKMVKRELEIGDSNSKLECEHLLA